MDSVYEKKPWLKNYPEWVPHDLKITPATAIGDFQSSAISRPQNPAVYYFDKEISYEKIDKLSDSLAAALSDFGLKKGDRNKLFFDSN